MQTVRDILVKSQTGISEEVSNLFKESMARYKEINNKLNEEYRPILSKITDDYEKGLYSTKDYKKEYDKTKRERDSKFKVATKDVGTSGLEDIYDALNKGKLSSNNIVGFGHGKSYFSSDKSRISEIFANYLQLNISRPDLIEMLKRDKPELVNYLDKLVDEILKKEK